LELFTQPILRRVAPQALLSNGESESEKHNENERGTKRVGTGDCLQGFLRGRGGQQVREEEGLYSKGEWSQMYCRLPSRTCPYKIRRRRSETCCITTHLRREMRTPRIHT